jgi:hypothetical protein
VTDRFADVFADEKFYKKRKKRGGERELPL